MNKKWKPSALEIFVALDVHSKVGTGSDEGISVMGPLNAAKNDRLFSSRALKEWMLRENWSVGKL